MKCLMIMALCFFGCDLSTEIPGDDIRLPEITIIQVYGNDAIDATVEYTVTGSIDESYLLIDHARVEVIKTEKGFAGIFAVPAAERMVVVVLKGKTFTKSF